MSLRSKSIQRMNSSILNVFEPKFSIFTQLQHASYSRILHIMLIFCCKVTLKKATCSMTKKMPISFFTFVLLISMTISSFQTQTCFKFFPAISFTFRPLFSKNIVQNPQIRLRETETKHLKRLTFPHNRPHCFHIFLKARIF